MQKQENDEIEKKFFHKSADFFESKEEILHTFINSQPQPSHKLFESHTERPPFP